MILHLKEHGFGLMVLVLPILILLGLLCGQEVNQIIQAELKIVQKQLIMEQMASMTIVVVLCVICVADYMLLPVHLLLPHKHQALL